MLHLILNWNWIRLTYFQAKKGKSLEKNAAIK
jgi:hypothetical protein